MTVSITDGVVDSITSRLHAGAAAVTSSSQAVPASVDAGDVTELVEAALAVLEGVGHTIGARLTTAGHHVQATSQDLDSTDRAGAGRMSQLRGGI